MIICFRYRSLLLCAENKKALKDINSVARALRDSNSSANGENVASGQQEKTWNVMKVNKTEMDQAMECLFQTVSQKIRSKIVVNLKFYGNAFFYFFFFNFFLLAKSLRWL